MRLLLVAIALWIFVEMLVLGILYVLYLLEERAQRRAIQTGTHALLGFLTHDSHEERPRAA